MGRNGSGRFTGTAARKIIYVVLIKEPGLSKRPGSFVYPNTVMLGNYPTMAFVLSEIEGLRKKRTLGP